MPLQLNELGRKELKKPLGHVTNDDKPLLNSFKNKELITVGDKVTQRAIKLGIKPKLAIVDYKTKRGEINYNYAEFFEKIIKTENPPGTISSESIEKIKEAKKYKNILLEVRGEEDLLVIPVILEFDEGIIWYGQPDEGVVILKINKNLKKRAMEVQDKYFY